jgi:WD40-like Beta Propeller Repeat
MRQSLAFRSSSVISLMFLAGTALVGSATAGGCGSDDTSTFDGDGGDGSVVEDSGPKYSAVRLEPVKADLDVTFAGGVKQAYKAFGTLDGTEREITGECGWSVDSTFGGFDQSTFISLPRGGSTKVAVTCSGGGAEGDLSLHLKDAIVTGGAPPNAGALFGAATLGTDAAKTPAVEYPLEGAVLPLNIPAIDSQWTTGGGDLFHLTLTSNSIALDLYTKKADAMIDPVPWGVVATSTAGETIEVKVEAMTTATPAAKFASGAVKVKMSRDRIDNTAIYYWASSKKQIMTQTFGEIDKPTSVIGDCTSCHSLSRTGSRMGYSRCVGGSCSSGDIKIGFRKYDVGTKTWKETVDANARAIGGSFTTFSPKGYPFPDDAKSLAIVTTPAATLELYDPDTGAVVPSNLAAASVKGPGGTTRAALMADWSPDGRTIVFSSSTTAGDWIDPTTTAIATMSYELVNGTHTFGDPKLIVSNAVTAPGGSYANFFFPSISPDGKLIVFNASRAPWRSKTSDALQPGPRFMLTDLAGSFTVDLAGVNGPGESGNTWPHWAPSQTSDYLWIAFSNERNYGHLVTPATSPAPAANQGHRQYKQIWIGAIEKAKIPAPGAASPTDPSAQPVWLPGQDLDADNISPYWTLPTTSIAK